MTLRATFYLAILLFISACGGGGGGGASVPPVTTTVAYSLEKAYKDLYAQGWTVNYNLTGTCTGTSVRNEPIPVGDTFIGISAYSVASTETITATSCTTATVVVTAVRYNDINLNPLGYINPGLEYAEYAPSPVVIPASVKVGDTAVLAVAARFTNNTKGTPVGTSEFSYIIEPDTANTAIVNLIEKRYDLSVKLEAITQDRYRIDENGKLTPLTLDVMNLGAEHFIFTPI